MCEGIPWRTGRNSRVSLRPSNALVVAAATHNTDLLKAYHGRERAQSSGCDDGRRNVGRQQPLDLENKRDLGIDKETIEGEKNAAPVEESIHNSKTPMTDDYIPNR